MSQTIEHKQLSDARQEGRTVGGFPVTHSSQDYGSTSPEACLLKSGRATIQAFCPFSVHMGMFAISLWQAQPPAVNL